MAWEGVTIIKVLKWAGRIVAIVAVILAIVSALSGSWGDAIYALLLAGVIWYWTDVLVARMARSRSERAAKASSVSDRR